MDKSLHYAVDTYEFIAITVSLMTGKKLISFLEEDLRAEGSATIYRQSPCAPAQKSVPRSGSAAYARAVRKYGFETETLVARNGIVFKKPALHRDRRPC